jgi:hypothetical protein
LADTYVVVVESNLVAAIERAPRDPANPPPGTTLEVGTALAQRYRDSGCIDGRYAFEDASGARTFSVLCLLFTKGLAEKRLAAVEALPAAFESYRPEDRLPGGRDG